MKKFTLFLMTMMVSAISLFAQEPAAPKFSPVATDGTVQYLYNVDTHAFVLGANDWGTRASVSVEKGNQFKVTENNGAYKLSDLVGSNWNAIDCDGNADSWVDGGGRSGDGTWGLKDLGNNTYEITNTVASAAGKVWCVVRDLSNTRVVFKAPGAAYSATWAFVNAEDYDEYIANLDKAAIDAYITTQKDVVNEALKEEVKAANMVALNAQLALIDGTNVYDADGFAAYKSAYETTLAAVEAGTYTETVVNPSAITGWHASTNYNFLLTPWTVGGEKANNFEKALYINTWSTEGTNDGSNFLVPFFEYWTGDDNSLSANVLQAKIEGLVAGKTYEVEAWTRVRVKNGQNGAAPYGITLQAGNGEAVNACGEQVGTTQMYLTNVKATGTADENGVLAITYTIDADNNISWLSYKNVKYAEAAEPEAPKATVTVGTNAYDDVTVNDIPAYKAGTSKAAGEIFVTVPAGTKTIKFSALAWKGANDAKITIKNGESTVKEVDIEANDGISSNSPFTTVGEPNTDVVVTLEEATTEETTFTFTSDKRFVMWNVNIEKEAEAKPLELATVTITEGDKVINIASSNAEFVLQKKFREPDYFEGDVEAFAKEEVEQMAMVFGSAEEFNEGFAAYATKGSDEIDVNGMEEVYAPGTEMLVVAYNIAWDEAAGKVVLASNVASYTYTVPAAKVEYATLTHTAAVQGGSNEAGSTIDAESHYYNNWGTAGWAAQAYIGFDVTLPEGMSITKATLSFTSHCGGNKNGRTVEVYGLDNTADFDWANLELAAATGTKLGTFTDNLEDSKKDVDVTAYLKTISNGKAIFQLGGAAAGAYVYGKTSEFAPTLNIEVGSALDALVADLDNAIAAANSKKGSYNVGEGLFQYAESEIKPLADAIAAAEQADKTTAESINAAIETLNTAVASFAPKANDPKDGQAYILTLTTANNNQLSVSADGIKVVEEGTPVYFVAQENGYAISNGTEYVNYAGTNTWTMAASTDAYGWTITAIEGGYSITGKNGLLGTNAAETAAGSVCYGDKKTSNGNYIWTIAEFVEPKPEIAGTKFNIAPGGNCDLPIPADAVRVFKFNSQWASCAPTTNSFDATIYKNVTIELEEALAFYYNTPYKDAAGTQQWGGAAAGNTSIVIDLATVGSITDFSIQNVETNPTSFTITKAYATKLDDTVEPLVFAPNWGVDMSVDGVTNGVATFKGQWAGLNVDNSILNKEGKKTLRIYANQPIPTTAQWCVKYADDNSDGYPQIGISADNPNYAECVIERPVSSIFLQWTSAEAGSIDIEAITWEIEEANAIESIETVSTPSVKKMMVNGKIVIVKGDKQYNMMGVQVK